MPSAELRTLLAVHTRLSMQHSEGGTITTPSLQMGSKFREAGTLPEATQQASAVELGSAVRRYLWAPLML